MTQDHYSEAEQAPQDGGIVTLPADTATRRAAAEIRGLMAARHHSAVDLGPVLGLSRTAATRRFNGDVNFTIDELEKIAGWLDVPITRLISPAPGDTYST